MNFFGFELKRRPATESREEVAAEKVLEKRRLQISEALAAQCDAMGPTHAAVKYPVLNYVPPKGVCPPSHVLAMDARNKLAQDASPYDVYRTNSVMFSTMGFPGYPYLTELTQISEYRDMYERVAAEMVRKWIKLRSVSRHDQSERISGIEKRMKQLGVRDLFRRCKEVEGSMGRAQIFVDLGDVQGEELGTPLMINRFKIPKGSLRGLKLVEPITTYPFEYNSSNPLAPDFYKPSSWYVYGQKVHASRMMTLNGRALPDLLKPTYNFSGISLCQLAEPYVNYFLNTRDSVGKLLKNFSTTTLKTNMADALGGGDGNELFKRAQMFIQHRDNQGLFLLDKDSEELGQINTPLSGLDKLQAQAQEHLASVAKTPLAILLGVSPTGLNPSSESEIRIYYDYIAEEQEKVFRTPLEYVIQIIQLDMYGDIDDDIVFDFVSLFAMTAKELAQIRKSDGETDVALIGASVVSPEEVRSKIAADPESGYDNLDVEDPIGKMQPNLAATEKKIDGQESAEEGAQEGAEEGAKDSILMDMANVLMLDAMGIDGWHGNKHTGSIGGRGEFPYATSSKASGVARKATSAASRFNTRTAHVRALGAHRRALEAHQHALETADADVALIHQAYIDAHQSAMAAHQEHIK